MSDLNNFFGEPELNAVYAPEACEQRKLRIRLANAAYAYEYHSDAIMSDGDFDDLCLKIDTSVDTGNPLLDEFFKKEFNPSTGMWIHKHPEKHKLEWIYQHYFEGRQK